MEAGILIMAGGKSSRMDYQDKAMLRYNGETFLSILYHRLNTHTAHLMVSEGKGTREEYRNEAKDAVFVKDIYEDRGPIGGLYSALSACKEDSLFVVACDMPYMQIYLYEYLKEFDKDQYDAIIPLYKKQMQPMAGIYKKRIVEKVKSQIASKDFTMKHLLRKLQVCYVEVGENKWLSEMLQNVNTVEEYKELVKHE